MIWVPYSVMSGKFEFAKLNVPTTMSADNFKLLLQKIVVLGQFMSYLILYKKNPEILQNDAVFSL